jgi:Flp pilus assembly protein TadG
MTRLVRRWRDRRERGETLIEFALGAALLFTVIFGVLQFGWAVWQYNLVADLAQEGARYGAVHGSTASSVATSTDISNYVNTRGLGMLVTTSATWPNGGSNAPGSIVQVTVTRTPGQFSGFVPAPPTLRSTAQMVIAR